MISNIDLLLDRILAMPRIVRGVGATERDIEDAERQLGLKIPSDYAAVLRRAGWLGIGPQEIWGLGPDVPEHLHLIHSTHLWRANLQICLPGHLLPIQEDGGGNLFCLDCSCPDCRETPIIFWDHDADLGNRGDLWAATLSKFLVEDVDNLVADL